MSTTQEHRGCAICLAQGAAVAGEVDGKPACEECVDQHRRAQRLVRSLAAEGAPAAARAIAS